MKKLKEEYQKKLKLLDILIENSQDDLTKNRENENLRLDLHFLKEKRQLIFQFIKDIEDYI